MNKDACNTVAGVEASLLQWMTVHGNLCLALRHPSNTGASREIAIAFVKQLGQMLVEGGLLTQEELEQAEKLEIQERER